MQERIAELERENNQLRQQLFEIKIAYQRAQKSMLSKSPFHHDFTIKQSEKK